MRSAPESSPPCSKTTVPSFTSPVTPFSFPSAFLQLPLILASATTSVQVDSSGLPATSPLMSQVPETESAGVARAATSAKVSSMMEISGEGDARSGFASTGVKTRLRDPLVEATMGSAE